MGIVLGKGVHPADVGRFYAVEHHIHGSDAQHGLVGVETGEHGGGVMALVFGFHQIHGVMLADVLRRGADKARAAHGGVYQSGVFDTRIFEAIKRKMRSIRGTEG